MTPAVDLVRRSGVAHEVLEYEHDPATPSYALEAAQALGIEPASVYKTLVASLADGRLAVAIVPSERQLDLKALAACTGAKRAAMAEARAAERATGYVLGGISPFGQKRRLPTVLDGSALGLERIYVSGGRRGLEIGLAPADLVSLTGAEVADIAR